MSKEGDSVPLYANKVGPFHNPKMFERFQLQQAHPNIQNFQNGERTTSDCCIQLLRADAASGILIQAGVKDKKEAFGEVLNGSLLLRISLTSEMRKNCKKKLSRKEFEQFRRAVEKDYYFQMYYDDLPIWGFIGKMDPHSLVDLTEDKEVDAEFMYTVKWKETETETPFEKRMDKYAMSSSLPHHLEVHWFSIINSCVTVLLLTGFLATILMRYIHGDVFRFPKHKSLFAASLGSGTQLFTLTIFIFMLSLVGALSPYNRGALFTALVVIHALTSGIAGYTASSFYCQLEGKNWSKYPREIPPLPWYRSAIPQMAMAGFLPFSAIYIELYYIFASVWGHRIYTIYSILIIVFIILLIVTAFITVALTYFQLAAEDHEGWWRSDMSGFMQTSFFFGYMACICDGFFLMLGTVGFRAALLFVRHIFD
ncbi:LOW QUALITY PROTEIN: hypothetical protein HID58_007067 [Brassica napus]|uniref:Transmembrane 9 superfamily member n=2 Tax=Brassica napus TaxID=3708 RepID=A0ABQ8EG42_BRANA|nr:LOW QUALITY PROTEIN: hypothetical protein HID58_007067 [Brassica napus]